MKSLLWKPWCRFDYICKTSSPCYYANYFDVTNQDVKVKKIKLTFFQKIHNLQIMICIKHAPGFLHSFAKGYLRCRVKMKSTCNKLEIQTTLESWVNSPSASKFNPQSSEEYQVKWLLRLKVQRTTIDHIMTYRDLNIHKFTCTQYCKSNWLQTSTRELRFA